MLIASAVTSSLTVPPVAGFYEIANATAKAGEVDESATEYLSRQQIEEQLARARAISKDGRPEFVILGTSTLVRLGFLEEAARSSLA